MLFLQVTEQAGYIDHTGGDERNRQYRVHRLASENRLESMNETEARSPNLCFPADSYLVYKTRRDSQPPPCSASVPGIYVFFSDINDLDGRAKGRSRPFSTAMTSHDDLVCANPYRPSKFADGRHVCGGV